jgi:hypothetical protein
VADPVAFAGVEEQNLIGLGYGLVTRKMADVEAAIRKHQFCGSRALFRTLVTAAATALNIPDDNGLRFQ